MTGPPAGAGEGARPAPGPREGVIVRDARDGDVPRLIELLAGGALTVREDPSDPEPYRLALAEITADPHATVLVAEVGGLVVGTCQLMLQRQLQHRGGRCAEVESVHVDAGLRSRGIGAALMAEAEARAVAAGCFRVQLTSNGARTDAHRFYRRLGYQPSHVGFKKLLEADG